MILFGSSSLRKIILLVALIFCNHTAMAGLWGAVSSCFLDPCNCGDTDPDRTEYHEDEELRTVTRDSLCPPWNKEDGRDDDTCIVLADYPTGVILDYENLCGEEVIDSTYFMPRIRVRGQQCNALSCWVTDNTLDWDGECVTLASGLGIFPLHRMCARVAFPRDELRDFDQDPGYTNGKHLDWKGATVDDEEIVGVDGVPIDIELPKLCLYYDPSLYSLDLGLSIDLMDLDQTSQPTHKLDGIHPIAEVILFFFSVIADVGGSISDMLDSLFAMIGGGEEGQTTFGSVISGVFDFIGQIIVWVGDLIEVYLNEIAQVNRDVKDTEYGCVNIPLGPFPPPFCDAVIPFLVAEVEDICVTGNDGMPVPSVSSAECHVSKVENNYLRNSVRVGYGELIPLCRDGENPNEVDTCVNIDNLGAFSSAQALHISTAKRDVIKHCNDSSGGAPCVESMVPHSCSVSNNGCEDGFRIVYGQKIGGMLTPKTYFRDDVPDCSESGNIICQEIWGINRGEFVDISLVFPTSQTSSDISPIVTDFSLRNKNGEDENFNASIVRISGYNSTYGFRQEPNQICVFQDESVVGCRERAAIFKPSVYECSNSPEPSITCTSSYFAPKFIVSYNTGTDSITSVIEPRSIHNSGSIDNSINLAGDIFEAFVTDDSFASTPFSGANSPNPSSIYGVYQDGLTPITDDVHNEDAVYLSGLEYISDNYHLGGKYACLRSLNSTKCPHNQQMCVLTSLINKDTVLCSTFFSKLSTHNNLGLCTADQSTTCSVVDSMPTKAGGEVSIRSCSGNIKCYDGTEELCKIGRDVASRINPASSLGDTLSDDQYYNTTIAGAHPNSPSAYGAGYDVNEEAVRDKTAIEMGLCVTVPQGTCTAEVTPSKENGYATWPSVNLGEDSYGTCSSGMKPKTTQSDLVRKCVANPNTNSFNLEPVYRIVRDPSTNAPSKVYPTNIECVPE